MKLQYHLVVILFFSLCRTFDARCSDSCDEEACDRLIYSTLQLFFEDNKQFYIVDEQNMPVYSDTLCKSFAAVEDECSNAVDKSFLLSTFEQVGILTLGFNSKKDMDDFAVFVNSGSDQELKTLFDSSTTTDNSFSQYSILEMKLDKRINVKYIEEVVLSKYVGDDTYLTYVERNLMIFCQACGCIPPMIQVTFPNPNSRSQNDVFENFCVDLGYSDYTCRSGQISYDIENGKPKLRENKCDNSPHDNKKYVFEQCSQVEGVGVTSICESIETRDLCRAKRLANKDKQVCKWNSKYDLCHGVCAKYNKEKKQIEPIKKRWKCKRRSKRRNTDCVWDGNQCQLKVP